MLVDGPMDGIRRYSTELVEAIDRRLEQSEADREMDPPPHSFAQFQSCKHWVWFQYRRQAMPRKRFKTEEIIQKFREVEVLLLQSRNVTGSELDKAILGEAASDSLRAGR